MNEQGSPAEATHASTMSQHILVVEDEQALALGIRDALLHAGYEVDVAHDGNTAMEILKQKSFDLVVLDIMLPGRSGLEVLRELRQERHDVRVVVLTALADESDVVRGFELGADDYMAKPFSPRELVARVNAQFRRREMDTAPPPQLDLPGGIQVDLAPTSGTTATRTSRPARSTSTSSACAARSSPTPRTPR
jgi:DNA-binding response OmpR family regulator